MKLVRTFHPVGHGAFYTERFYKNNPQTEDPIYTTVFDCGCFEACKAGTNPQFFENQINQAIDQVFNQGDVIDALFISHFHTDHINGIPYLNQKCTIKKIFVPILTPRVIIEAYIYNYISAQGGVNIGNIVIQELYNDTTSRVSQVRSFRSFNKKENVSLRVQIKDVKNKFLSPKTHLVIHPDWEYVPFNLLNGQMKSLLYKGSPFKPTIMNGRVDFAKLQQIVSSLGITACQTIYNNLFPQGHNSYSMTTLSSSLRNLKSLSVSPQIGIGNMSLNKCMYMGDFEANPKFPRKNNNFKTFQNFYYPYWNQLELLQVPHHGSEHNYNHGLYNRRRVCVISSGATDKYGHPDQYVINEILRNNCLPIVVTEVTTRQEFIYQL